MKTEELKNALNFIYASIQKRKNSEFIFHSFIFDTDKIIGINETYYIECPFQIESKAVVPAEELMKIINGIEDENLILKVKEKSLSIKTKGLKAEIACYEYDEENISLYISEPKGKFAAVPESFNKGIKLCLFSASKNASSGFFNTISVRGNTIQSTDNYRISKYDMEKEMDEFLLPLSTAIALSGITTKQYVLEKNMVHFKNADGSTLHSKIISAQFPDVSKIFNIDKKNKFDLPDELSKTVSLVSVFSEAESMVDKRINIDIKEGVMKCRAESQSGWIESDITLKTDLDLSFSINPVFFVEILKLSSKACTDGEKKIIFESDKFSHLISLKK